MRIGTISLNINTPDFNYGAMLHSWAFQQYLLRLAFVESAEVIDYTMPLLEGQHREMPLIDSLKHGWIRTSVYHLKTYRTYRERLAKFVDFVNNNLIVSEKSYFQSTLDKEILLYDVVICESDVIWSPDFCGGSFDKSFFLALDSMRGLKRIAYAPSMGDGRLSTVQERELRSLLQSVDHISCRESYEKEILERHTEKKVTHVLDPVMLLESEDYDSIISPRLMEEKYILLYLPVDENVTLRDSAMEYAGKNRFKVLEITTKLMKNRDKSVHCLTAAGIEEFLSGLKYAEVVFTNSFHAICFSIIFSRQFYAFSRGSAGKVRDICHIFGLKERYFEGTVFQELPPIDYEAVHKLWRRKKEESQRWLTESLKSGE